MQSQIYASAPNQNILSNTATAFLQGLYPPLTDIDEDLVTQKLNNGSDSSAPLEGYQYVLLEGVDTDSPGTIWIKGDEGCPAYTESAKDFPKSEVYQQRVEDTRQFYHGMYDYIEDVYDLERDDMSYENAYTLFDLINVARIHNTSAAALDVSDEDMLQLRTLADSSEFGQNYNASQPERSVGARTLAGGVLKQLNETIATEGKLKFSLLSGSYDTFLAFFGIMDLIKVSDNFTGLPDYASTMAFELFSDNEDEDSFPAEKDLKIRWMLKNGTEGDLTAYPLFGQEKETLSWTDFKAEFDQRAITKVGQWCNTCQSTEDFCAAYDKNGERIAGDGSSDQNGSGNGGMSNVVAGVVGAAVTLAVVGIVGAIAFVVMRRKASRAPTAQMTPAEKRAGSIGNESA